MVRRRDPPKRHVGCGGRRPLQNLWDPRQRMSELVVSGQASHGQDPGYSESWPEGLVGGARAPL